MNMPPGHYQRPTMCLALQAQLTEQLTQLLQPTENLKYHVSNRNKTFLRLTNKKEEKKKIILMQFPVFMTLTATNETYSPCGQEHICSVF
jgi:hypothetical protein